MPISRYSSQAIVAKVRTRSADRSAARPVVSGHSENCPANAPVPVLSVKAWRGTVESESGIARRVLSITYCCTLLWSSALASTRDGPNEVEMRNQLRSDHELCAVSFRVADVQSSVRTRYQSAVPEETRLLRECHALDQIFDAVLDAIESILVDWQGVVRRF
jgi:hypothetical protein